MIQPWFLYWFIAIAISGGVYFLYKIGPKGFVGYAAILGLVFWFWFGEGFKFFFPKFGSGQNTPYPYAIQAPMDVKGAQRFVVPLQGKNQWMSIDGKIPACTRYVFDWTHDGVEVRFRDGAIKTFSHQTGVQRLTSNPVAIRGEGVFYLWLFEPIGKDCQMPEVKSSASAKRNQGNPEPVPPPNLTPPSLPPLEKALGMTIYAMTPELAKLYKRPGLLESVVVTEVAPDSQAAAAGIQVGDAISKVNSVGVDTVVKFRRAFAKLESGSIVRLHIHRDGFLHQIDLRVPESPK